jgi:hypothetical protein
VQRHCVTNKFSPPCRVVPAIGMQLSAGEHEELFGYVLNRKAVVWRYACTDRNDGQCHSCAFSSRLFSCQQPRSRIRRPLWSVTPSRERRFFNYRCAVCHGADGRGHGPDSVVLRHPVADLTLISQRSGGIFPYNRVKGIIEGNKTGLVSQGDREMPIWGQSFMRSNQTKTGAR